MTQSNVNNGQQDGPSDTSKKPIIDDVRKFKREYYEQMDIDRLVRKLNYLATRLEILKDHKKLSSDLLDLYYLYLQTVETLFINAYAFRRKEQDFPVAIFIDNAKLKLFIESEFINNIEHSKSFINELILSIHEDRGQLKQDQYHGLLKECAKDYIDNYQLLNAYKHGARVSAAVGPSHMSVGLPNGQLMKIADGDSAIHYYSKETDPNTREKVIYERDLVFKKDRITGKVLFVITLLQNMRLIALKTVGIGADKPQKYMYFQYDKDAWRETFGGYTWKSGLFTVSKGDKK